MSISRYEIRYSGGFSRFIQVEGTITTNQIMHLQKPVEDRRGPDDFSRWKVVRHSSELRETSKGVMELVAILDLERFEPEEIQDV